LKVLDPFLESNPLYDLWQVIDAALRHERQLRRSYAAAMTFLAKVRSGPVASSHPAQRPRLCNGCYLRSADVRARCREGREPAQTCRWKRPRARQHLLTGRADSGPSLQVLRSRPNKTKTAIHRPERPKFMLRPSAKDSNEWEWELLRSRRFLMAVFLAKRADRSHQAPGGPLHNTSVVARGPYLDPRWGDL